VKAWLSREGVEYVVRNVDQDLDAYNDLLARGFRSIPITIIGEVAVRGYQPEQLKNALDAGRSS
jgi:hypothetical protein